MSRGVVRVRGRQALIVARWKVRTGEKKAGGRKVAKAKGLGGDDGISWEDRQDVDPGDGEERRKAGLQQGGLKETSDASQA